MKKKRFCNIVFCLYGALMLILLFDRAGYDPSKPYAEQLQYNLVPFETIRLFWRLLQSGSPGLRRHAVINLVGNVVMFIPLGFLLPKVSPRQRRLWRTLLTTALIIVLVEMLQLFSLRGSCDVDDLILNVLGAAIGYGVYRIFGKK